MIAGNGGSPKFRTGVVNGSLALREKQKEKNRPNGGARRSARRAPEGSVDLERENVVAKVVTYGVKGW